MSAHRRSPRGHDGSELRASAVPELVVVAPLGRLDDPAVLVEMVEGRDVLGVVDERSGGHGPRWPVGAGKGDHEAATSRAPLAGTVSRVKHRTWLRRTCICGRVAFSSMSETEWLPEGFESVAFRLARAEQAALEIGQLALAWSNQGPIHLEETEVEASRHQLVVTGVRPIPPLIAMLFSEAVNHLRSAIENTVFRLVERERGEPLSERQSKAVEMPILEDEKTFDAWLADRVKRGIPELGRDSRIGRAIARVQPFVDDAAVSSISADLAQLMGADPELASPMLLLRKYSNEDKHRAIRTTVPQSTILRSDESFSSSDRRMRSLQVGQVLYTRATAESFEVTLNPAVFVRRPGTDTPVAPLRELDGIHRHVAHVVIPTLVRGLALTKSLPPAIELGDSGQSDRQRLDAAGWEYAWERASMAAIPAFLERLAAPPERL